MLRIGTSYFPTFHKAMKYYRPYCTGSREDLRKLVQSKLDEGLIHIGEPLLKPGETKHLIDDGTRWEILAPESTKHTKPTKP